MEENKTNQAQEPMQQNVPAVASVAPSPNAPATGQKNFLAAFLLNMSFGIWGANRLYMGQSGIGWTRFALGMSYFLLWIPFVNLLMIPVFLVAAIWSGVDFFIMYLGRNSLRDGQGQPLLMPAHDEKVAKILFIITIVIISLLIVLFILGFLFGLLSSLSQSSFSNGSSYSY